MYRFTSSIFILFLSITASAELDLKPVRGESVDYTYNKRLSFDNSLISLKQINSALISFEKLTDASKDKITIEVLKEIGNTELDIQQLGFYNWSKAIEGTLYKQEYLIKKVSYDLALEKFNAKKIAQEELSFAESELKLSEDRFQNWWNSLSIAD